MCGELATQRDHCPPKCLFPKPLSNDIQLITAPICEECHEGTEQDDEYFRAKIALHHRARGHPAIEKGDLVERTFRGLKKPEAEGFRRAFVQDIRRLDLDEDDHVWLHTVDLNRLSQVVRRTIRGLHWYEMDENISRHQRVHVACEQESIAGPRPDGQWREAKPAVRRIEENEPEVVKGEGVFRYAYSRARSGTQRMSAWLLTFYNSVRFLGVVTPPFR